MTNVFKIKHGKETHVYRTDMGADKKSLLSQFRHVGEELAAKKRKEREGKKFGKSTGGGSLWLDPEMTSPYTWYQYFVNTADADVIRYLRWFTFLDQEELSRLEVEVEIRPINPVYGDHSRRHRCRCRCCFLAVVGTK